MHARIHAEMQACVLVREGRKWHARREEERVKRAGGREGDGGWEKGGEEVK